MVIWKKINDDYLISSAGKVYSLKSNKILSVNKVGSKQQYFAVDLYENGKRKRCLVHRLVAEAFIPNPNNLPEINHKSECTTQNFVDNLEWCDRVYNNAYSKLQERLTEAKKKQVYQYSLDGELINVLESAREAARQLGYSQSAISRCCNNTRKTAYGFIWSYKPL